MLERTLRVLEFNKIKDMMKPLALSDAGRELIEKLEPTSDLATAQLWQQETELLRLRQIPAVSIRS